MVVTLKARRNIGIISKMYLNNVEKMERFRCKNKHTFYILNFFITYLSKSSTK
jgi:hypothetical protein